MGGVSTFDVDTPEFDHIFGPPGHVALAVAEDDNLVFTNAPEGLALHGHYHLIQKKAL